LPEPEEKQLAFDCEKEEDFQTSSNQGIEGNAPIIKQTSEVERLEKIIDCNV
jgi:hypothetical protein